MNASHSPVWTDGTTEFRHTGTWRSALPDYRTLLSPCLGACPVDGRIADWIGAVRDGDIRGAFGILVENNPFPAVIGRICHHPCQSACNRQYLDETVSICNLERFVGDAALARGWMLPEPAALGALRVAVVGSGPAGLALAYHLRRAGVGVTIFEARAKLGGLLRHGIPAYRLDKAVLDGEIDRLLAMGIDVRCKTPVADAQGLAELRGSFDAVYLATGATRPKRLEGLDYSLPQVIDSADFLTATNASAAVAEGERIVVIGGGSAAMDVARTARRLGREVTVLALEPDDLLPAQRIEIDEAREEGITFETGAMMQSLGVSGAALIVNCIRVDFRPGETRGAFTIEPRAGTGFELAADLLIPSIGQDADLEEWAAVAAADGPVMATDAGWQTGTPGLFAGGDLASMDRFVSHALGMGKQAARAICDYLDVPAGMIPASSADAGVSYEVINTHYHVGTGRNRAANTDAAARLLTFKEVQQALEPTAATAEATRCFSCGTCIYCDNCYAYCPDMAITKLARGYEVRTDYCKGCGLCVAECPTGSIQMVSEVPA